MKTDLENHERQWIGMFIPAAVWNHPDLNCVHKCLYAEVHALGGFKGNCFASNKYLGNVVGVKERQVSEMISKLIGLGMMRIVRFDGRKRYLQTLFDRDTTKEEAEAATRKTAGLNSGKPLVRQAENRSLGGKTRRKAEREGEDVKEDGCLAPARSCPEPKANNVAPFKRTNQQPESIKEVVQFALSQAGYAGTEADEFLNAVDFSLDSATLLAGLPDHTQEPFARAFRFTRLNNGKDWPTHSWRQAYKGWADQLRDDEICDVPGWWVATVGDNNVTAEAVF